MKMKPEGEPVAKTSYQPVPGGKDVPKDEHFQLAECKNYIIKDKDIVLSENIGSGAYGTVWRAIWKGKTVAVKKPKESSTVKELEDFAKEANIMM